MPPKVINWTDDLCKALADYVAAKHSAGEIAKMFSEQHGMPFTRNMVIGKCHRLRLQLDSAQVSAERRAKADAARLAREAEKAKERAAAAPVAAPAPPQAPTAIVIPIEAAFIKPQPIGNPRRWIPRAGGCKYPLGEPRDPGFRYCGEPVFEQDHYCATHGLRCYVPTEGFSAKRRRRERAAALELASAAE